MSLPRQSAKAIGGAAILTAAPCITYYEGMIPKSYADPVGIPTACAGVTSPTIKLGQTYTTDQCAAMNVAAMQRTWRGVAACIYEPITAPEGAAILSWAYNVGPQAACTSTLMRLLNAGAEPHVWCSQLTRWTYTTKLGISFKLNGLVKRRATERAMCNAASEGEVAEILSQSGVKI